jgi:small-conductance mechanosensitive channel
MATVLILILALAINSSLFAQRTGEAPDTSRESDTEVVTAAVVMDGETLFSVRGVTAYPAARRASEIAERIRVIAADPSVNLKSFTVEERRGASVILANGRPVVSVLDEDAAIERISRNRLAELYATRIWEAVQSNRHQRRPGILFLHALITLCATVALLVAGWLTRRVIGLAHAGFERRYQARMKGLEDRAHHIVRVEQFWRVLSGLLNLGWALGLAVMLYAYLQYVLSLFPWTKGIARNLLTIAIDPVRTIALGFVTILPNLAFLAILTIVVRYVLKILRILCDGLAGGTIKLEGFYPEWAWATYRLIRLLLIVFAVVVAYPYIPGSGSEAFKGVSLFMGIVFSLGSSSLIGNLIAGYTMTYRRAFRVGDRVKIGDQIGTVERMRVLVTHLRTIKNEEVIVPNSSILANEVTNYSSMARDRGLVLHTTVGIGYETPWRQVEAMLLEAATLTRGLRTEPAPFVLQKGLGDFCVTYEINVYCDKPEAMEALYTDLHRNVLDVFNRYEVQIMTPAYEHDPDHPKVVPKDRWYEAPAKSPDLVETDLRPVPTR